MAVRTLKELDYSEQRTSLLLGFEFATAETKHGRLSVIGSGNLVRFELEGKPGCVDLRIDRFADAAVAWLAREEEASGDAGEATAA